MTGRIILDTGLLDFANNEFILGQTGNSFP